MRSTDRESRIALVHQLEIDEFKERLFERGSGVKTGRIAPKWNVRSEERSQVGLEEIRDAAENCLPVREDVRQPGPRRSAERGPVRHRGPEFLQPLEQVLERVSGDQACIDRTD